MNRKILLALMLGFVIGSLWLIALRFITQENKDPHHHANFALYINGQQDKFDNFTFYEEVQSCGPDEANNPRTRIHMHDHIPHVIHVHDSAATWGHFFANIGYGLGSNFVKTDAGVYVDGRDGKTLSFILNGEIVDGVANQTVASEDMLLINYGDEDQQVLQERFGAITRDASEFNTRNDPSSCSGSKQSSFMERLKNAIGLDK